MHAHTHTQLTGRSRRTLRLQSSTLTLLQFDYELNLEIKQKQGQHSNVPFPENGILKVHRPSSIAHTAMLCITCSFLHSSRTGEQRL